MGTGLSGNGPKWERAAIRATAGLVSIPVLTGTDRSAAAAAAQHVGKGALFRDALAAHIRFRSSAATRQALAAVAGPPVRPARASHVAPATHPALRRYDRTHGRVTGRNAAINPARPCASE